MTTDTESPVSLIVNADDYGLTAGVSAGIRRAFAEGIVTSTTAMMNQPGAAADLHRARTECPDLGIGVHLVLTAGRPIRAEKTVSTLIDGDGRFFRLPVVETRFEALCPFQVRDEWRAQVDALVACGVTPDHLDSHHHISYSHPRLLEVMLDIARDLRLPVRLPTGVGSVLGPVLGEVLAEVLGWGSLSAESTCRGLADGLAEVGHPDFLASAFCAEAATVATLSDIAAAIAGVAPREPGRAGGLVAELMCHPGDCDADLESISSYAIGRAAELAALVDPAARAAMTQAGVHLVTFAALAERGTGARIPSVPGD